MRYLIWIKWALVEITVSKYDSRYLVGYMLATMGYILTSFPENKLFFNKIWLFPEWKMTSLTLKRHNHLCVAGLCEELLACAIPFKVIKVGNIRPPSVFLQTWIKLSQFMWSPFTWMTEAARHSTILSKVRFMFVEKHRLRVTKRNKYCNTWTKITLISIIIDGHCIRNFCAWNLLPRKSFSKKFLLPI